MSEYEAWARAALPPPDDAEALDYFKYGYVT